MRCDREMYPRVYIVPQRKIRRTREDRIAADDSREIASLDIKVIKCNREEETPY
jgi:hypothetical protein